jgi:FG-GAP-like repeat/FG-GAP repeat
VAASHLGTSVSPAGQVSVLLGNGDGTFRAAVDYDLGSYVNAVAVGDFNGDGIPDLAVANASLDSPATPGNVSILLGNGDGTFRAAVNYTSGGVAVGLAVADVNGDGIPDLVVANVGDFNNNGQGGNVSILLGNGDGTFQGAVNYTAGLGPESVAVRDFNGDGIPDLAVVNFNSNNLSILLGKGDGTFQAAVNYAIGPYPGNSTSVAVKDFNGDGIPDLAVAFGGGVRMLLGNGDGTFQSTAISYLAGGSYYVGFFPQFNLAAGDFNGDGLPDLAVVNSDARSVSILLNDGKWMP